MILVGGLLVLGSWIAVTSFLALVGIPFVIGREHRLTWMRLASATWWGLAIVLLVGIVVSFVSPLRSVITGLVLTLVAVLLFALGAIRIRDARLRVAKPRIRGAMWLAATLIALFYLGISALGPVTHYDAGLYQVAATWYAADFSVIPGIANLYAPLGYGSGQPVLGALMGLGPWDDNGYRLVNGLFLSLLALESTVRVWSRPRTAATAVSVAGTVLALAPMLWMADFWVASPTPDVTVLALSIATAVYLVDLVTSGSTSSGGAAVTASQRQIPMLVILSGLMIALRPTMIPFAALVLVVAAVIVLRRRAMPPLAPLASSAVLVAALVALGLFRDRVLSGWWLYPLSLLSFDVPWRASDPSGLRAATLGFARNPQDFQSAITGWDWIGPWTARLTGQWEPWLFLVAVLASFAVLALAHSRGRQIEVGGLVVSGAPFALAIPVWFVWLPPAFRFGWGPLFGLTAVLVGWAVWRAGWSEALTYAAASALITVTALSAFVKLDFEQPRQSASLLGIPYSYVPLPTPPVEEIRLDSGVKVLVPIESDQCWARYPLCTPSPLPGLRFLGERLETGLVS
ncbi:hypothetical protein OAV85_00645 [Candidatus Nanopelagicales bacterium]|nr:hypothetical protein [Candidatus Nanopelagicales bacterium]